MSKTVKLVYPDTENAVMVDMHLEGATVRSGGPSRPAGSKSAEMTVTGNYTNHIKGATGWQDGLYELYGRRAGATVDELRAAVDRLGTVQSGDYWEATPGNAGAALEVLLGWAREYPDGEWRVY